MRACEGNKSQQRRKQRLRIGMTTSSKWHTERESDAASRCRRCLKTVGWLDDAAAKGDGARWRVVAANSGSSCQPAARCSCMSPSLSHLPGACQKSCSPNSIIAVAVALPPSRGLSSPPILSLITSLMAHEPALTISTWASMP